MSKLTWAAKASLADVALDLANNGGNIYAGKDEEDIDFFELLLKLIMNGDEEALSDLLEECEEKDVVEVYHAVHAKDEIVSTPLSVKVTKQSRKRDKKRKDDKRREYSRHYCSPGTPRVKGGKGETEYVLPAKRSKWKKFLKNKSNRTVRRHKGYLPKGNGYRKMDDDLWIWW